MRQSPALIGPLASGGEIGSWISRSITEFPKKVYLLYLTVARPVADNVGRLFIQLPMLYSVRVPSVHPCFLALMYGCFGTFWEFPITRPA